MYRKRSIAIPTLCGIVFASLVVFVNAYLRHEYGLDALRVWVILILPFGALCLGFIASLGFVAGARYANYPASSRLFVLMAVSAVIFFMLLPIIGYFTDIHTGVPVNKLMSLGEYLQYQLTHSSMKISRSSAEDAFDMGKAGFLLPLGNLLGFVAGMHGGFILIRAMPHCENCRVYFETTAKHRVRFPDNAAFLQFLGSLPQPSLGRVQSFARGQNMQSPVKSKKGAWEFRLVYKECPDCHAQFATETAWVHNGQDYQPFGKLKSTYFILNSPAPQTVTAEPMPSRARQFGRRSA